MVDLRRPPCAMVYVERNYGLQPDMVPAWMVPFSAQQSLREKFNVVSMVPVQTSVSLPPFVYFDGVTKRSIKFGLTMTSLRFPAMVHIDGASPVLIIRPKGLPGEVATICFATEGGGTPDLQRRGGALSLRIISYGGHRTLTFWARMV